MPTDEFYATDLQLVWYRRDRFARKVEDELYRFRRYEVPVSLLFLSFPLTSSRKVAREINAFVMSGLRRLDFAGILGRGDFAVCLPHTDRKGVESVASRLRELTMSFPGRIGIATAESDVTFREFLEAAILEAKASLAVAA